ncbi:MAG TPA: hypothetical protein VH853_23750, partial [Polyangia bacterium]|nr:hypothetical protein [Polyangia bacterium]
IWLVELAAEGETEVPRASGSHLLHHISLRNALDQVSKQCVDQAQTNEFRWLEGLGTRLKRDREVPWSRKEVERLAGFQFSGRWSGTDARPPGSDPSEVVNALIELGVLRERADGSVDVPDIYLDGLGLTRKGGVARG